jgi:hypothetical protein
MLPEERYFVDTKDEFLDNIKRAGVNDQGSIDYDFRGRRARVE